MRLIYPYLFAIAGLFSGCDNSGGWVPPPESEPEPGAAVLQTEVTGLSGICYNASKDGLWAVSDKIGVFELNMDGTTRNRPVAYTPGTGKDFEGVACVYASGEVFLVEERERGLYRLDGGTVQPLAVIANTGSDTNKGLEGIAADQNGSLYIANQENPWVILKYSLPENRETARTASLKSYFSFISDLCCDPDGTLWVADSKQKTIFHCTLSVQGTTLTVTPFESQSVSQIDKAEALLVDKSKNTMWVGDDTTGKIHRIIINMQPI